MGIILSFFKRKKKYNGYISHTNTSYNNDGICKCCVFDNSCICCKFHVINDTFNYRHSTSYKKRKLFKTKNKSSILDYVSNSNDVFLNSRRNSLNRCNCCSSKRKCLCCEFHTNNNFI